MTGGFRGEWAFSRKAAGAGQRRAQGGGGRRGETGAGGRRAQWGGWCRVVQVESKPVQRPGRTGLGECPLTWAWPQCGEGVARAGAVGEGGEQLATGLSGVCATTLRGVVQTCNSIWRRIWGEASQDVIPVEPGSEA